MSHITTENQYCCYSAEEKYSVLEQLMLQGKTIYLFGVGGSGKSYTISKVIKNNTNLQYNIYEYSNEKINNTPYIMMSNSEPNNLSEDYQAIIEFRAIWN